MKSHLTRDSKVLGFVLLLLSSVARASAENRHSGLMAVLAVIMSISSCADTDAVRLPELTSEQRTADIAYFFEFVRKSYPFLAAMDSEKGLGRFLDLEAVYVERAKNTQSHLEFMALFMEIMQRVEQGTAHADVATPLSWSDDRELEDEIAQFDISLDSFYGQKEWWKLFNTNRQYSFSDIRVGYLNGNYVTSEDYVADGAHVPRGSVVLRINDLPADEYVRSCQSRRWLRFDSHLKKPYYSDGTPFVIYGDRDSEPWVVRFRTDGGDTIDCELPKLNDLSKVPSRPVPESNVICRELTDDVGYLKVASFPGGSARRQEARVIREFITRGQDRYGKLILDLRRNSGGSPVYWEDNLIGYLIDEPVEYVQYAAVKKWIFDRIEKPFRSSRPAMRSYYDSGEYRKVTRQDLPWTNLPSYFNDRDWYFFEIRRTYQPMEGFHLKSQVFVLTDNDCFSATEDFVKTVKQLQLATLVGATTAGGAAAFIEPWLFELPNSHIIFTLEIELAFNPDGTINEIYGTRPDFELEPSRYPTTYPTGFSREELLNDSWIQWIIKR